MFLDAVNIGTRTLSKVDGPPHEAGPAHEAGPHTGTGGLYRMKEQPSTDCLPLDWNTGFSSAFGLELKHQLFLALDPGDLQVLGHLHPHNHVS